MDFEFDELKREFLSEADEKIREIKSNLDGGYPPPNERIERMIYLAHQLKGAGGSYGFATISTESAELERELEQIQQNSAALTQESLSTRVARIASVIEERAKELAQRV
jgi:chemotaxis protein histidine kinase CheA